VEPPDGADVHLTRLDCRRRATGRVICGAVVVPLFSRYPAFFKNEMAIRLLADLPGGARDSHDRFSAKKVFAREVQVQNACRATDTQLFG
jgi:hypothetical protein